MTKVRFTFVDVQGNPLPLMEFKLIVRRASFNDEEVGVTLPEQLTVVTDATGQVIVDLWPLKTAYRIQIAEEYEELCGKLNWSFYVPQTDEVIEAQTLFLVPPPNNIPWDEEAMGKITQAVQDTQDNKEAAKASADAAAGSATSAGQSAATATTKASQASSSAASALASKNAAALSETASGLNAEAARQSSVNAGNSAIAAAQSATQASTAGAAAGTAAANAVVANKQDKHANLTAFSGLVGAADRLPYFSGAGALSLTTLTGLARNLLDDTTQSGMQSTLGLAKQTSVTDTTAGSLMTVGAFGLGTDSQPTDIDPNTVQYGSVMSPVSQPNAPCNECVIWSGGRTTGARSSQLAIDHDVPARAWIRGYNSGRVGTEWAPWTQLWTSASANAITVDTGSMGYGTGSGGKVTQATSKSTEVTLNKPSGQITMSNELLAAGASVQFQLRNNKAAVSDTVVTSMVGGGSLLAYSLRSYVGLAGSIFFVLKNELAVALSEPYQFNFTIIKGATS